tara:strand:- start:724 stop:963 length:240 start_codon:yes stop_codon:yes gene_type:complete
MKYRTEITPSSLKKGDIIQCRGEVIGTFIDDECNAGYIRVYRYKNRKIELWPQWGVTYYDRETQRFSRPRLRVIREVPV